MSKVIIYPNGSTVSVLYPGQGSEISSTAKKIVPAGVPYLILDINELPVDKTYRAAWTADFSNPDGYGQRQVESGEL